MNDGGSLETDEVRSISWGHEGGRRKRACSNDGSRDVVSWLILNVSHENGSRWCCRRYSWANGMVSARKRPRLLLIVTLRICWTSRMNCSTEQTLLNNRWTHSSTCPVRSIESLVGFGSPSLIRRIKRCRSFSIDSSWSSLSISLIN